MFRRLIASVALVCALFALGACQEAAPPPDPAKTVPTNPADSAAWKAYVSAVSRNYVPADQSSRIFATFVEHAQDEEKNTRTVENIRNFISRGIADGTTILFASPDSVVVTEIIEKAFAEPNPTLLKGIRVIFIGQKSEEERVRAAVTAWGATFVFHEAR
jgi:hypothetical protein